LSRDREATVARIRYVVVGAGNIAQGAVLPAFAHALDNSELVGICSSNDDKRAALARAYNVRSRHYSDLDALVKQTGAQAAYIALPNHLHREYTERAARLGLHVLCEKPMAPTVAECQAMIRVAREQRVRLMIAYRLHFEEANLHAVDLIRSGKIGEPVLFSGFFTQQVREGDIRTRADVAGGALGDAGIYCINAARYLFAAEPVEVVGFSEVDSDARFHGVDATTVALLRFPKGKLAQLGTSQAAAHVSSCRVIGTRGDIRLDPAFDYVGERRCCISIDGKTEQRTFRPSDQFAPELLYFSRCILENQDPEPSGEEGLADVRVIEAIGRSVASGKAVMLAPFVRSARPGLDQLIVRPWAPPPQFIDAPPPAVA
jgi:predicted dehydrogenase